MTHVLWEKKRKAATGGLCTIFTPKGYILVLLKPYNENISTFLKGTYSTTHFNLLIIEHFWSWNKWIMGNKHDSE